MVKLYSKCLEVEPLNIKLGTVPTNKQEPRMNITVIGAGAWGTALANHLAILEHSVKLWAREKEVCESILAKRVNKVFLPGVELNAGFSVTNNIGDACLGANTILMAVPSQYFREIFKQVVCHIDCSIPVVSATKGIEVKGLKFMSQIVEELLPGAQFACLSGPSFAKEVAEKKSTAVVIASKDAGLAKELQKEFSSHYFRIYTDTDVIGVQCANSMKNIIALAAGISDGIGFGENLRAALITRGLVEIKRLGSALGANPKTFNGLAGIGDLILTCVGNKSRNRQRGLNIARGIMAGENPDIIAEGVKTCEAVHILAQELNIEMPITQEVYRIIYENKDPHQAMADLMTRPLKDEKE